MIIFFQCLTTGLTVNRLFKKLKNSKYQEVLVHWLYIDRIFIKLICD